MSLVRSTAGASRGVPGDWAEDGACRRSSRPTIFFPAGGDADAAASAKLVCKRCPVSEACLEFALVTNQQDGVWGGLAEDERRRLRRVGVAS